MLCSLSFSVALDRGGRFNWQAHHLRRSDGLKSRRWLEHGGTRRGNGSKSLKRRSNEHVEWFAPQRPGGPVYQGRAPLGMAMKSLCPVCPRTPVTLLPSLGTSYFVQYIREGGTPYLCSILLCLGVLAAVPWQGGVRGWGGASCYLAMMAEYEVGR